ncbi:uncharacterized protein LOC112184387 isoform X1 [Rosa chinensis]|uniref:uncharacterized protein LOC112184387 isoform X1 n=1 Tax=Rosa chinensis TaxID=74649 RepID=UPI001AD8E141|nr:uncharacterized protein LOC112184387 isoform X1 [Rosa chinensis]
MQKTFANIFLLLFLCLLFNIILVLYCYSDLGNSLQSDSLTVIDPVMLPNTGTTKGKRSLQQRDHYIKSGRWKQVSQQDPVEEEEIVQINNEEIDHQAKSRISKRRKQVSQPIMTRENQLGEMNNQNVDIMEDRGQQEVVQITDEYQHSYGQASYQRSRQGSAIAYEDSGFTCYYNCCCN